MLRKLLFSRLALGNHDYNKAPDIMSGFFKVTVLPHVYFNYLMACVCLFIHSEDFYEVSTYLPEYRLSTGDMVLFTTDLITSLLNLCMLIASGTLKRLFGM